MTIGNIIEARRKELGLTLECVGNAAGVGKSTVKKWEKGTISSVGSDKIMALSKILRIKSEILTDIPPESCKCGYNPILQEYQFTHEEYHQRYEQAIKKYGIYYDKSFRDDHRGEMDSILSKNPPLDKQIECQTEKLKCYFSESLFNVDYDLRHCAFNDYVAMILNQEQMFLPMSDECKAAMVETYGKKRGIPKGKFYQIPDETDSDDIFKYPNIKPIKKVKIPMLGNIACGEPTFADEQHEIYIETDGHIQADFCLTCAGDSMEPKLMNGDIVFIRKQREVNDGQIAAVLIEDEATLKRVYYDRANNILRLIAENPKYDPLIYSGEQLDHILILGKAVSLFRKIK